MKHTIFPTGKPFVNKDGFLVIPTGMLYAGQASPKLTPREWWYLFCRAVDDPKRFTMSGHVGSGATVWRVKKSLEKKGYL